MQNHCAASRPQGGSPGQPGSRALTEAEPLDGPPVQEEVLFDLALVLAIFLGIGAAAGAILAATGAG